MINQEEITFLYQGDLKQDFVANYKRTKQVFPNSKFVISTFSDQPIDKVTKYLKPDDIIISETHPEKMYRGTSQVKVPDNTNNHIISTREGLKKITTKYTFKLRTDFAVLSPDFLYFWDKFPKHVPGFNLLEHKLLIPEVFTRNPHKHLVYHPSDLIFFGLTSDLLDYFDVPMMKKETDIVTIAGLNGLAPEQYLFMSFLAKKGKSLGTYCQESLEAKDFNKQETDKYFVSNFIVLNWRQLGTTVPTKFNTDKCKLRIVKTCYSMEKLSKIYEELTKDA